MTELTSNKKHEIRLLFEKDKKIDKQNKKKGRKKEKLQGFSSPNIINSNKLRIEIDKVVIFLIQSSFSPRVLPSLESQKSPYHKQQNGVLVISRKGPLCFSFHTICLANVLFLSLFLYIQICFGFLCFCFIFCQYWGCYEVKSTWVLVDPAKYVAVPMWVLCSMSILLIYWSLKRKKIWALWILDIILKLGINYWYV